MMTASQKLGEKTYADQQATASAAAGAAGPGGAEASQPESRAAADDNVVDAEFKEVKK